MSSLSKWQTALEGVIGQLKAVGLYEGSLDEQLVLMLEHPDRETLVMLQREFGGHRLNIQLYVDYDSGRGLSLAGYALCVPAAYQVPEHFVHNGVDSAQLDHLMGSIDWYSRGGWLRKEDYLHADYRQEEVGGIFRELYRFAKLEDADIGPVQKKVQGMVHYLAYRHFDNSPLQRRLLAGQGDLSQIFHREIAFPPWLHVGVPGHRARDTDELERLSVLANLNGNINREIMNLNNLQKLQEQMEQLGFSKEMMGVMEERMKADLPKFTLLDPVPTSKGAVELTLHFKQSGKSDFYYLNRMEAVHNQGRALKEGEHYQVHEYLSDGTYRPVGEKMESFYAAADYFRNLEVNASLMVFKGEDIVEELVRKENGAVNYLHEEIKKEFNTPSIPQVFWLENGKGFEREQVVNLMQGRAVYRQELLSREGNVYNAWMQLDTDKARDSYGNLGYRQYTDGYGFDVKAQLQEYRIVGVDNAKKLDALVEVLKNGGRPEVQVEKDGQKVKLLLETAVRYGKLNFYREYGRPEKREQFLKETALDKAEGLENGKAKSQGKAAEQAQGMGV